MAGGKIYFVDAGITITDDASLKCDGSIRVIDIDGTNETVLVSGTDVTEPDTLEVDTKNGKVYWTNMGVGAFFEESIAPNDGSISRANLDGSNVEIVVPTGITTTPKQIALDVDNGKMYWADRGDVGKQYVNPKVMRANLDGTNVETIISSDVLRYVLYC